MAQCCFRQGCELEAHYTCLCLSSRTYSCGIHLEFHLKLPFRSHTFDSILEEPCKWTKSSILEFLTNEKFKKEKIKKIVLAPFGQNTHSFRIRIDESLRMLNSDLEQNSNLIEKISKVSEQEQSNF